MLLENLIETKIPCEVLIPLPRPSPALPVLGASVPRINHPKVNVLISAGSALHPSPPSTVAVQNTNGSGGAVGATSAFVAPGSAGTSGGGGSISFDRRKSTSAGSVSADALGMGESGLLHKSLAGRSLTIDTRGVGVGVGGRLVDGRASSASTNEQRVEFLRSQRVIGQAFRAGELECECKYSRRFPLYHRLQANRVLGTLAISPALEGFRVQGRSGLYVYPDKENNFFYITLTEVR